MFSDPVVVAVPPKGGSLDDVLERLSVLGWLRRDLVEAIRRLVREDKRRIKLEEGLMTLWDMHEGDEGATLRAADQAGHDLDECDLALVRMRRWQDAQGRTRLGFTPKIGVDALLHAQRQSLDPVLREAATCLHLEMDLVRYGRPCRTMFDHLEFEWSVGGRLVHGILVGTDHEVTPTYLRRHKRDLSLTCYDAFQNTLLDAVDTGKVHNWQELMAHLIEANTDVRILGSLGLDDYLGHFVLMPTARARRLREIANSGAWNEVDDDAKLAFLAQEPVLIDANYEGIYLRLLDADRHGIRFEHTTSDIEQACAAGRSAIYIVRSGRTIAATPGLCVVGRELVVSETIVAVNRERLDHNRGVGLLAETLAPSPEDRSAGWRRRLAQRLGDSWIEL